MIVLAAGAAGGRAASPSLVVLSADRAPSLSGEIYRIDPNGRVAIKLDGTDPVRVTEDYGVSGASW